jgi:hypothetical protein
VLSIKYPVSHIFLAVLLMLFIFFGFPGISISADETSGKEGNQLKNPYADAEITIKIISSANNTFGYDLLMGDR